MPLDLPNYGKGDSPASVQRPPPRTNPSQGTAGWDTHERYLRNKERYLGIRERYRAHDANSRIVFSPLTLSNLSAYAPTRLEFVFPHAEHERKDEWFELAFSDIFYMTNSFAKQQFSIDVFAWGSLSNPMNPTKIPSPWGRERFCPLFLEYASQVARQDNVSGGWDALLLDPAQRSHLVTGVLSKVLMDFVFSDLLFGANARDKKHLEAHDDAKLLEEGYKRTYERARIVRDALDGNILTEDFWPHVDALAIKTVSLLLPLVNLMERAAPAEKWPSLSEVHQQIHNIISEAAYVSVCMRLSRTVFQITFPEPGDIWELEYQQVDSKTYEKSKADAIAFDDSWEVELTAWKETENGSTEIAKRIPSSYTWNGSSELRTVEKHKTPMRIAKVKIVLWPLIRRYKPLGDPTANHGAGAPDGERITTLFKSRVLYYWGRSDNQGEMWERKPGLQDHIEPLSKWPVTLSARQRPYMFWFTVLFLLLAAVLNRRSLFRWFKYTGNAIEALAANSYVVLIDAPRRVSVPKDIDTVAPTPNETHTTYGWFGRSTRY